MKNKAVRTQYAQARSLSKKVHDPSRRSHNFGNPFGVERLESRLALAGNLSIVADLATGFQNGGIASTSPNQMTESGGKLFFVGDVFDPSNNTWPGRSPRSEGLWVTDGSGQGTKLVKEIIPYASGFDQVRCLTDVSGTLFFAVAPDGIHATELWKSDGTTAGTVMIKRFDSGTFRQLAHLTALNGRLTFELDVTTQNQFGGLVQESQLWISDGAVAGTLQIATFNSISTGTHAQFVDSFIYDTPFYSDGQSIYFSATHKFQSGATFGELHRFDGMSVISVKAFPPNSARDNVGSFTKKGGEIFFSWGNDLWRTDGTSAGTQLVTTTAARLPTLLTTVGSTVFFAAGDQIMSTDGTPGGTKPVLTLETVSPNAVTIIAASGKAIVFAEGGVSGPTLNTNVTGWTIDTLTGTTQKFGYFPSAISQYGDPRSACNVRELWGRVYFTANDNLHGWEVWETDGTMSGTTIHDVWQPPPGSSIPAGSSSSYPDDLTTFGGVLYFSASEQQCGAELWKLTPSGTSVQQPTIILSGSAPSLGPNQTATITFTLSESSADFTVTDVTVSGGTLTNFTGAGTRYTATFLPTPNTVTTGTLLVAANTFTNAQGTGNMAGGTLSISINTIIPTLSITDARVLEGNTGTALIDVIVKLSASSALPVSVDYATADGMARAGSDYIATSGTLTFLPGETQKTIRVAIYGDTTVEPDETFSVRLSNTVNASIPNGLARTIIIQNDDGQSAVFVNDLQVAEGTGGTTTATFTIQLAFPMPYGVSVRCASLERTATPRDKDYQSVAGTVLIPTGQTSVNVPVTIIGDARYEPDEKFAFRLVSATGVPITRSIAYCTIVNDDPIPVPVVTISDVRLTEGQSAQKLFAFIVSLSERSPVEVSVDYGTADISATGGIDYTPVSGTLRFMPGVMRRSITVWVKGDTTFEATEQFLLNLATSSNATLGRSTGVGTIINDDKPTASRGVAANMFAAFAAEQSLSKPMTARRR